MAKEKDRASKRFFSDAKIFSELINLTLFNGKKIVKEKDLKERDPVKSKAFSKTKSLEVLVDNLFDVEIKEDNRNTYAIIGLESQAYSDKHMVIRSGIASLLIYDWQLSLNKLPLKPVYIIVLNMQDKAWNETTMLSELFSKEDIASFGPLLVNSSYIVADPHKFKDEDFYSISNPLKLILKTIKIQADKNEFLSYINSENAFQNLDENTAKLLESIVNIEIPKDGGYNMCKAFEEIKKDAKLEGKLEGNKEGKTNTFFELTHEGLLSREIAAEKLNISLSEYTKLEKEFFDKKSATC